MGCGASSVKAPSTPQETYEPPLTLSFTSSRAVEHSAVSLAFLQRFAITVDSSLTTSQVVFGHIIPATNSSKCRFTDQLDATDVGKSTYFVSHRWQDNFHRLVQTVTKHVSNTNSTESITDPSNIFIWLDIFAVNQHPGAHQIQDLDHLSASINSSEKGTLLVMDDEGKVLTRIWCLFEIHTTVQQRKAHLAVLMPQTTNFNQIKEIWTEVDVLKAQVTVEADRNKILKQFEQSDLDAAGLTHNLKQSIVESSELRVKEQRTRGDQCALLGALETCAQLQQFTGQLEFALELMEEAEKIGREIFNRKAEDIAYSFYTMGSLLQAMGKHEDALSYYEKGLAIRRQVFGDAHPDVATSYIGMGSLLQAMGKHEDALLYYEKGLAIHRQVFGDTHPYVAIGYGNKGSVLQAMGKHEDALSYYEKGLAIHRQVHGDTHPHVATSYSNLGSLFQAMGKYEDALAYYEKGLAIRRQVFGDAHPDVATSYSDIRSVLQAMGKHENTHSQFEKGQA